VLRTPAKSRLCRREAKPLPEKAPQAAFSNV
jgi:hypothetical protein